MKRAFTFIELLVVSFIICAAAFLIVSFNRINAAKCLERNGAKIANEAKAIETVWANHGNCAYTTVIEIEGHKYVLYTGYKSGGVVHAESCSCKSERK